MIADKENTNPPVSNDMSVVVRDAVEGVSTTQHYVGFGWRKGSAPGQVSRW